MTRIWQGLYEYDKNMTRTLRKRQDYDKDYKKMTRLWQGLFECEKIMTRTDYDKDYKN